MDHSETLDVLLLRVGAEVAAAADCLASIQVGSAAGPAGLSDVDLVDLQKLDLVEQTLRSLVTVLEGVAAAEVGAAPLDLRGLIEALPLAELSDRLRGTLHRAPEPSNGMVELF